VVIFEKLSNYMNRVEETHAVKQEESKTSPQLKPAFVVKHYITTVDVFVDRLKSVQFVGQMLKLKSGDCGI